LQVSVTLSAAASRLRAHVEATDDAGHRGVRDLNSASHDCAALADTTALAIAMSIDLMQRGRASSPPPSSSTPPSVAASASPAPSAAPPVEIVIRTERPIPRRALTVFALIEGALGTNPTPAFGPTLGVGWLPSHASLELALHADVPAADSSVVGANAHVRSSLFELSLAACYRQGIGAACGVLASGAFYAFGTDTNGSIGGTAFTLATGASVRADIPITRWLSIRVSVEVLATLVATQLLVDGARVWQTPFMTGRAAIGPVVTFR
jgi:hypothetical protein